jgi:hypothetical protein
MGKAQQTYPGSDFEQFWAGLERTRAIVEEIARRQEETERAHKETERAIKEVVEEHKETERVVKEVGKQLGELKNSFGQVVEHMVVPNLVDKFRELGFEFGKAGSNIKFKDRKYGIFTEVDVFLEDGDKTMAVETKDRPTLDDVAYHVERMGKLRRYADLRDDSRKYLGAIAGIVIHETVRECILANGLYVVKPSGDTFNITAPEGNRPREW